MERTRTPVKSKPRDRPPSPTHVFLTPFQESENPPNLPDPFPPVFTEPVNSDSTHAHRPQRESSFLQSRKKSPKSTKNTGFGGLPIDPGLDHNPENPETTQDQTFSNSWLDNSISRLGDPPCNISQKCVMAKNRMTNWCRSKFKARPESEHGTYQPSDEFIPANIDSGKTNLGFKYSDS